MSKLAAIRCLFAAIALAIVFWLQREPLAELAYDVLGYRGYEFVAERWALLLALLVALGFAYLVSTAAQEDR